MELSFLLGLLLLALFGLWYFVTSKPPNFPPGPLRLPLFGGLLFFGNPPHNGLRKLIRKYGKICGLYCGNYPAVILSDLQLIKDAFKDDRISARPPLRPFLERSWGKRKGLIFGTGEEWAEQRKFAINAFKSLGFGTSRMETQVLAEVIELNKLLEKDANRPISVNQMFHVAIVNTLWHIVAGSRFEYDDPELHTLIKMTGHVVRFRSLDSDSFMPMILFFLPWLTHIAPNWSGWNNFLASFRAIFPVLQRFIEEHKTNFDPNNPKDLIDIYLKKIQETGGDQSSFSRESGEKSLLIVLLDLFVAGGETASSNLTWGILFLASHPEIQAKAHQEIDQVVGKNRLPSVADRPKMQYLEAIINEVLRMVTIGALSIFHSASEPIPNFHGYSLPKDCIVFGNFWEVHHDPKVWGDPEVFRPERFIESPKSEVYVFSTGKRICPGESLARDELFLFTCGMLQRFRFELDPDSEPPCLDPMKAAVLRSHSSKLILRPR